MLRSFISGILIVSVVVPSCTRPEPSPSKAAPAPAPEWLSFCRDIPRGDSARLRRLAAERITWRDPAVTAADPKQRVKLLGFNDLHGWLTEDVEIEGRRAGGGAVLASYLEAAAAKDSALIVHAGDLVGASPPAAALHKDEPVIAFMNLLANEHCKGRGAPDSRCNVVAGLGNHELDEGRDELMRLLDGGNSSEGPFLEDPYRGARFPMLGANVVDEATGRPMLPAQTVITLGEVRVGVIGAVLPDAARYLMPSGISSLRFEPVAASVNRVVEALERQRVRAVVLLLHDGGFQRFPYDRRCGREQLIGPLFDIVGELDEEIDVVISGHSHSGLNMFLPNRGGRPVLVTQAFNYGTAFADIDLTIDMTTGDIAAVSSAIITTWADTGPGRTPDPEAMALMKRAADAVQEKTGRVIAEAAEDITRLVSPDGESPLGNLIADAERRAADTDIAFVNPSWVRTDIEAGPVTWGDLFVVHPFGNQLVRLEMTGRQLLALLNQQDLPSNLERTLQVSGLSYTWDPARPKSDRIVEAAVNGAPLEPEGRYTVAVNEFLAEGGERYSLFTEARRLGEGPKDIDALARYLESIRTLRPITDHRIRRVPTE